MRCHSRCDRNKATIVLNLKLVVVANLLVELVLQLVLDESPGWGPDCTGVCGVTWRENCLFLSVTRLLPPTLIWYLLCLREDCESYRVSSVCWHGTN